MSTLARSSIYDRAYPKKPLIASRKAVGLTKRSSVLLFVQPDEKLLEELTKVKEIYFLTTFRNKSQRKIRSQSKRSAKRTAVHIAETFLQLS